MQSTIKYYIYFRLDNSVYSEIEHPRWGLIQSVTGLFPIEAGQEIFTNYGYDKGGRRVEPGEFPYDFPWFWETKAKIEKEERIGKETKQQELRSNKKKNFKKKKNQDKKKLSKQNML